MLITHLSKYCSLSVECRERTKLVLGCYSPFRYNVGKIELR